MRSLCLNSCTGLLIRRAPLTFRAPHIVQSADSSKQSVRVRYADYTKASAGPPSCPQLFGEGGLTATCAALVHGGILKVTACAF